MKGNFSTLLKDYQARTIRENIKTTGTTSTFNPKTDFFTRSGLKNLPSAKTWRDRFNSYKNVFETNRKKRTKTKLDSIQKRTKEILPDLLGEQSKQMIRFRNAELKFTGIRTNIKAAVDDVNLNYTPLHFTSKGDLISSTNPPILPDSNQQLMINEQLIEEPRNKNMIIILVIALFTIPFLMKRL